MTMEAVVASYASSPRHSFVNMRLAWVKSYNVIVGLVSNRFTKYSVYPPEKKRPT